MGHPIDPPLHDLLRPDQLDLRLLDFRGHAVHIPRAWKPVSDRVVHRIAGDAEPGHLRHSHAPVTLPQPTWSGADRRNDRHRGGGPVPPFHTPRRPVRVHASAPWLSRDPGADGGRLPGNGRNREVVLLRPAPVAAPPADCRLEATGDRAENRAAGITLDRAPPVAPLAEGSLSRNNWSR